MKICLVGGSVRDMIMNNEPKDKDYVIVGATEQDIQILENSIFKKINADGTSSVNRVGKNFPVFFTQ